MSIINAIHTPCKKCAFAIYDNKTQTGCHLNYLEKFRSKNVEILEAYDEEKEFYIINEKKCLGYRENSWFDKRGLSNLPIEEKINKYNEDHYIHYLAIINLNHFDSDENFNRLQYELSSLKIKPKKIVLVRYQYNKNHPYEKLQKMLDDANLQCKWRVQTILQHDKTFENILYETMNLNKKYRFVLSVDGLCSGLDNIVTKANTIVYDEMERFAVIRNEDRSALLFSAPNYRFSLFVEHKDILLSDQDHIVV